jgi:hypothetical protein
VSRAILVRVAESVVRIVHVEDGVAAPLEMLPILAPERMADLLAAELAALAFERDGATCKRIEPDGIEVSVDLAASTAAVKLGAGARIEEAVELAARGDTDYQGWTEAKLRGQALTELEARVAERTEALRREITAQLEAKLGDLRRELDGAIGRATIGALTEKAAQLGRIEETHQDDAGNVTIRVRL